MPQFSNFLNVPGAQHRPETHRTISEALRLGRYAAPYKAYCRSLTLFKRANVRNRQVKARPEQIAVLLTHRNRKLCLAKTKRPQLLITRDVSTSLETLLRIRIHIFLSTRRFT